MYTAILRKVGKSARDNPERYCGWFLVHCSSKKFERVGGEAMDVRLRVPKESNKSRFDSYSVRNSKMIVSHITFRDCRVHIFSDNLPRNSNQRIYSILKICGFYAAIYSLFMNCINLQSGSYYLTIY